MLRTRRLWGPAALVVLMMLAAFGAVAQPTPASADPTDGTLTVVVNRDSDANGTYEKDSDAPQPGIKITVTDAGGEEAFGVTDEDGTWELKSDHKLMGGRYFVLAEIPASLSELAPVAQSRDFVPFSTTVDLTAENVTLRMGVTAAAPPTAKQPDEPEPKPSAETATPTQRSAAPKFAVGDLVFRDRDRNGLQAGNDPAATKISVQLLDSSGDVVDSLSTSTGHYHFDNLTAGTYSVRFAGIPANYRLAPSGSGSDRAADSDPDYTGVSPAFTLGTKERNVRPSNAADGVEAAYINPTIDAGITPLRFAVTDRVWLDVNGDGVQQTTEPGAPATVSLISDAGVVIKSVQTDSDGTYVITGVEPGHYRLRFEGLAGNRILTLRGVGSDRTTDSDADPVTGLTAAFNLKQGAPDLAPAAELGVDGVDYVNQTIGAGLVGSYSIGDTVWRDINGNGVIDPGDVGVKGVTVQLQTIDSLVIDSKVTSSTGRFTFSRLPAGEYQVKFLKLPAGLMFTAQRVGSDRAVDSDAGSDGVTPIVTVNDENPADTTVDAGVTPSANNSSTPGAPGAPGAPRRVRQRSAGRCVLVEHWRCRCRYSDQRFDDGGVRRRVLDHRAPPRPSRSTATRLRRRATRSVVGASQFSTRLRSVSVLPSAPPSVSIAVASEIEHPSIKASTVRDSGQRSSVARSCTLKEQSASIRIDSCSARPKGSAAKMILADRPAASTTSTADPKPEVYGSSTKISMSPSSSAAATTRAALPARSSRSRSADSTATISSPGSSRRLSPRRPPAPPVLSTLISRAGEPTW